jgi:ubiquinone biosynthesis protein
MLWQAVSSVRDLGRLHEIASVLIRYGFGDLVRRLGLAAILEKAGQVLRWRGAEDWARLPPAARARRALEELGPTFVKLGQILSTRVDLLEREWLDEMGKLLDSAPSIPYEEVARQLTEDFGASPGDLFAEFRPEPLAAASISQVHRARLHDGREVVVKVRRPGIRPIVEADLRWLARFAEMAEAESAELASFRPTELVRQLGQSLRKELDFNNECRSAERVAERFAGYTDPEAQEQSLPPIIIPKVHWEWVSERVCVQDFIDGIPGRDLAALDQAHLDRKLLARMGARAILKMIVEDGFFHGDPHPGNVFYLAGNRIAFIDFGMMGRLTDERRDELAQLLFGLVQNDSSLVADILMDWTGSGPMDETRLIQEIQSFVEQYRGVPLKRLDLGTMLADLAGLLRQNQLALPPDLAMLMKAFISLEGMGRELDPEFDMAGVALPVLEQVIRRRNQPRAIIQRGWKTGSAMLSLLSSLPGDLSRLLRAARRGRMEVHIDVIHLRRVGDQLDRAANRITIGIVVAALIIGSAIVLTVPGGPTLFGVSFLGLIGFSAATLGGVWLLLSIWRTRKQD